MALFDDDETEDDQQHEDEAGSWGVDEADPDASDSSDTDPLADLDTVSLASGGPTGTLKRAVDPEAGVVIYAYKNGNAGGLSAVPLSETELAGDDRS